MSAPVLPMGFLPGGSEWIVIIILALLLFGAKRLPELARSFGKGMSEFKKAMNDATREINEVKHEVESTVHTDIEPKKLASSNPTPPATTTPKDS